MRIEVLIGSEDPIIFPLKTTKMVLGSGENCDIILPASGISRKHIIITTENDRYFVTDMGSTNGSFINEERLVPGRKTEFTSFFPVRLGENVLVSLLSDEEDLVDSFSIPVKEPTSPSIKPPPLKEKEEATTVISLNQLNKVKTEHLVLERNKKREIRRKAVPQKKAPVKPPKKTNYVGWFAIAIVAAAAYYNIYVLKKDDDQVVVKKVGEIVGGPVKKPEPVVPKANPNLVSKSELKGKDEFDLLRRNMKCTIDVEIYLCDRLPGARGEGFGVTQVGLTYNAFIDANIYYDEAKKYIKDHSNEKLLDLTAAYLFVLRGLPELDEKILGEDSRILVGFYLKGEQPWLKAILAFKPGVINQHRDKFNENHLNYVRATGLAALNFTEEIYSVY